MTEAVDRRAVIATALAVVAYVAVFFALRALIGPAAAAASVVPILVGAATMGLTPGLVIAVATVALTFLLWGITGAVPGETAIRVGSGYGVVIALLLAAAVGYFRDASIRARRERALLQAAMAQREEDIAVLVRELTNPLLGIATTGRVLSGAGRGGLDLDTSLRAIADEADATLRMLRELADAASVEARHLDFAQEPLDLCGLIEGTHRSFDAKGRTLELQLPTEPVWVSGDEAALATVLRHLLSNAVRYAPTGPIRLSLRINGRKAELAVRDYGPGIPAREQAALFKKFARLSTAGGTRGAGLGLYLSQIIVAEHGAQLLYDSPRDGGSRFAFVLPLR